MVSPLESITEAEFKGKAHTSDIDRITHLSLILKYRVPMFQVQKKKEEKYWQVLWSQEHDWQWYGEANPSGTTAK